MATENDFIVLLVDDTLTNLRLLMTLLEQAQCDVRVATSGKSALTAAQMHPPDLILLDVILPDMNGLALCEQFQSDPNLAHIPIVLITARLQDDMVAKARSVGVVDFVQKPLQLKQVMQKIDQYRR